MTGFCLCGELNRYLEQLIRFSLDMPVMGQFIKEAVLLSSGEGASEKCKEGGKGTPHMLPPPSLPDTPAICIVDLEALPPCTSCSPSAPSTTIIAAARSLQGQALSLLPPRAATVTARQREPWGPEPATQLRACRQTRLCGESLTQKPSVPKTIPKMAPCHRDLLWTQ